MPPREGQRYPAHPATDIKHGTTLVKLSVLLECVGYGAAQMCERSATKLTLHAIRPSAHRERRKVIEPASVTDEGISVIESWTNPLKGR